MVMGRPLTSRPLACISALDAEDAFSNCCNQAQTISLCTHLDVSVAFGQARFLGHKPHSLKVTELQQVSCQGHNSCVPVQRLLGRPLVMLRS